jgi:hypothetical protein
MTMWPNRVGSTVLGTELSLSSRGRMTLGVGEIFWMEEVWIMNTLKATEE